MFRIFYNTSPTFIDFINVFRRLAAQNCSYFTSKKHALLRKNPRLFPSFQNHPAFQEPLVKNSPHFPPFDRTQWLTNEHGLLDWKLLFITNPYSYIFRTRQREFTPLFIGKNAKFCFDAVWSGKEALNREDRCGINLVIYIFIRGIEETGKKFKNSEKSNQVG